MASQEAPPGALSRAHQQTRRGPRTYQGSPGRSWAGATGRLATHLARSLQHAAQAFLRKSKALARRRKSSEEGACPGQWGQRPRQPPPRRTGRKGCPSTAGEEDGGSGSRGLQLLGPKVPARAGPGTEVCPRRRQRCCGEPSSTRGARVPGPRCPDGPHRRVARPREQVGDPVLPAPQHQDGHGGLCPPRPRESPTWAGTACPAAQSCSPTASAAQRAAGAMCGGGSGGLRPRAQVPRTSAGAALPSGGCY